MSNSKSTMEKSYKNQQSCIQYNYQQNNEIYHSDVIHLYRQSSGG